MLYRIDSFRHMCIPLFRICFRYVPIPFPFKIWISLWKIIAYFVLTRKGTCTFYRSTCASDMCYLLIKLPSCTLVFVGLSRPLPEMVKGMCLEPAMLCRPPLASPRRGWMELPNVGDFCLVVIQKWMNHNSVWDPTTPFVCLIWYPELWLCVSVQALDKNDMIATLKTTFELLYGIYYWYALKSFIHCWYASKYSICRWYAPEHFIRHW